MTHSIKTQDHGEQNRTMKKLALQLIEFYQKRIGIFRRPNCVFYPSCSEYAKQAVEKHGALTGSKMAFFRILRCHPWQENHIDPVQ